MTTHSPMDLRGLAERLRNPAHVTVLVGKHKNQKQERLDGISLMRDAILAAEAILELLDRAERLEAALKKVSELALRGSNGGNDNAIVSIHDAADCVHVARAALASASPIEPIAEKRVS